MKIICDEQARIEVLDPLKLHYDKVEKVFLEGYVCHHTPNRNFYFDKSLNSEKNEFLILELSEEEIWGLDKLQSNLGYRKQRVEVVGSQLELSEKQECFIYEKREGGFEASEYHTFEHIKAYGDKELQLDKCDVYLLIPGKLEKTSNVWEDLPEKRRDVFEVFRANIDSCVEEEYNSRFAKSLSRKCIGEITLEIKDLTDGECYYQDALVGMVKHDTGICVLEIMVQNCAVGGNKLLNYYCGNQVAYIYEGHKYSLEEFLKKLHIRKYGKKRSMVFSYGNVREEEIINALANEEFPMGKIGGDFQRKLLMENIAQYDTAEVYVSEQTMFEKCENINVFGNQRLAYHAIEIFFVELILFQDAAVDKVYVDLEEEREQQKNCRSVEESTDRCEEISFDMSQAIRFADYDQFNFPTVRKSAQNVARCFGIDQVFEKYERNKALLESMIQANKRKMMERQDNIKNRFLFLLSAVAAVGTLGDIFYVLYQDQVGGALSYVAAFAIIAIIFGIYKLVMYIFDFIAKQR